MNYELFGRFCAQRRAVIKLLSIVIFLLLFSQCGGFKGKVNYGNPKSVSLAFYRALAEVDLEKAKQLGTTETQDVIALLQTFSDAFPEDKQQEEQERIVAQLKLIKKAKCEIEGDRATCQLCCDEAGAFENDVIVLKKVDKKWLVFMTKESLRN